MDEIDWIVGLYPTKLSQGFGNRREQDIKEDISPVMLQRDLGIEPSAEAVERNDERPSLQHWEILRRDKPFVVLLDRGRLVSVIDRVRMASDIAVQAIRESAG